MGRPRKRARVSNLVVEGEGESIGEEGTWRLIMIKKVVREG